MTDFDASGGLVFLGTADGSWAIDFVESDGGEKLQLASGGTLTRGHILGRERGKPAPSIRGISFGRAVMAAMTDACRNMYRRTAGKPLTALDRFAILNAVLAEAESGRAIIAGKLVPISASSAYEALPPGELRSWIFDPVRDSAQRFDNSGPGYADLRVFTPELWEMATCGAKVSNHPEPSRTGAPGRPTSMHLVESEYARRCEDGTAHESLAQEAKALLDWLRHAHPMAPRLTKKTIENNLRTRHRQLRSRP